MEQRRLRLGDILDDYCPRERRVTNHAIVAMIEDDIKQTRCTTCDAEHAYKGAKVPRRRKKDAPAHLAAAADVPASPDAVEEEPVEAYAAPDLVEPAIESEEPLEPQPVVAAAGEARAVDDTDSAESEEAPVEDGPVHRPLIRATLPRPEGQKAERPLPDFTVRHANARGGNATFRTSSRPKMRAPGNGNGGRPHGRFAGPRPGPARGGSHGGFRSGPRHGGKKRSR